MHFTFLSTFLSIFVIQALTAQSAELSCYVCDDCARISAKTPLLECNAGYFNTDSTTEATTMTTTTKPMETTTVVETTTTAASTTTAMPMPPTPPTAVPLETTTPVPTPPDAELTLRSNQTVNRQLTNVTITSPAPTEATTLSDLETTTPNRTYTASSDFRIRQVRALVNTDVTYHCYSVQKKVNGSQLTERGCARVTTAEAVCPQLHTQNTGVQLSKCVPCSMSKCNGSSALAISFTTLALALIAGLLRSN